MDFKNLLKSFYCLANIPRNNHKGSFFFSPYTENTTLLYSHCTCGKSVFIQVTLIRTVLSSPLFVILLTQLQHWKWKRKWQGHSSSILHFSRIIHNMWIAYLGNCHYHTVNMDAQMTPWDICFICFHMHHESHDSSISYLSNCQFSTVALLIYIVNNSPTGFLYLHIITDILSNRML